MEKQDFKILIDASRERVWDVLWDDASYREWTAIFSEGSRAETDWKKGSKVLFLSGKDEGMVSTIAENIPPEFMSIKHLGTVSKGIEDYHSEEAKKWAGALEEYRLNSVDGKTEVKVSMDITEDFKDYFQDTFPKALDKIKELAEK